MRAIILDIDGVVNGNATYSRWRKAGAPNDFAGYVSLIEPDLLAMVDGLAQEVGAGIVVSSNWRHDDTCPFPVDDVLRAAGLTVPIIGHTPKLASGPGLMAKLKLRGHEINAYVVGNGLALEDFVAFDDDVGASASPLGTPLRHGSRVIFTSGVVGIQPSHVVRARKLFAVQRRARSA